MCVHLCRYVSLCAHVCIGYGTREKYFLFSAKLCCGSDMAYQRWLLSITDLDYLPGVSYILMFMQMPAGFNHPKWPEVKGLPLSGDPQIPISVACPPRELCAGMAWFLYGQHDWQWALKVSCKVGHVRGSDISGGQVTSLLGVTGARTCPEKSEMEKDLETKSCGWKDWIV